MSDADPRLEPLLEVMLAIARQDFDVRAPIDTGDDAITAIAVGLNMLADELRGEVASRRELERAHADLQRTQAQLVHSGKLAAIGQLAAGVAHEINNPIQGIAVCLSLLQRRQQQLLEALGAHGGPNLAEARRRLAENGATLADAHEAIERVCGVTASLRTFARADDEITEDVDLADVVRVSCRLSESTARMRARVELDLQAVPPVRGNRGQLGQVVTNLLVNAIQAIPEGAPQRHRIRVGLRHAAGRVSVVIEDSGPGVPIALRERIFEPFFTTKPADVGTGLGLALVADIVAAHHGAVTLGDSVWGGARFEATFPAVAPQVVTPEALVLPGLARRPRVLIVDDEEMLLRLFASLLAVECDVVTASAGREAVAILADDDRFDLVVCDLEMPEVDGIDVYEAATGRAPDLGRRFVFATGGAVTARGRAFLDRAHVTVLQKPFRVAALLSLLRT